MFQIQQLQNKKTLVFGLNHTGKTFAVKYLSQFFKTFVITRTPEEWNDTKAYVGKCIADADFEFWMDQYIKRFSKMFNCVILDDFDTFFSSHLDSSPAFSTLMFRNYHIEKGVTIFAITRRPQNLPTKYYEIFENIMAFSIEAPNVIQKLNQICENFGEMVKSIPYGSYQFYFKSIGNAPVLMTI
jgi:hypothetical protein